MYYNFFFWKCFTVAAFSVLISFVILWFVFLVKGGQVVPRSVFLLFFLLLQSVSWRSLTWFWVRFRKVVFLSSLLQHWPPFRHRLLRTVWDQSSSAYVKLRFSKTNFHFQTVICENKLPFSKTYSHFQTPIFESKLFYSNSHFKADFDFPIQFFENKLRFPTRQTPIFQVKLKCLFKPPYIYPSRRNKRVVTSIHRAVSAYWCG